MTRARIKESLIVNNLAIWIRSVKRWKEEWKERGKEGWGRERGWEEEKRRNHELLEVEETRVIKRENEGSTWVEMLTPIKYIRNNEN